jgi:hypothetical protein
MNDPFVNVALQFSLIAAGGTILLWYLLCAVSALIWTILSLCRQQLSVLYVHYRQQASALTEPTAVKHLTKKVKVAYK